MGKLLYQSAGKCLLLVSIFLPACNTCPTIPSKIQFNLSPPVGTFSNYSIPVPPPVETYLNSDWNTKEEQLIEYIEELNTLIDFLLIDRESVRKWLESYKKELESEDKNNGK